MFIPKDRVPLKGSERTVRHNARYVGLANPDETVDVSVRLRPQAQPPLQPHQSRMSREEYEKTYGASPNDIAAVEEFAHDHELTVVSSDAARRTVVLRGTSAQVSAAFSVELRKYDHPSGAFRGRTGPIYIPTELDGIVTGVFGLDDRPQTKPHFRVKQGQQTFGAAPHAQQGSFTPIQVAQAYQFPTDTTGKGQCVAIIELGGGYRTSDLKRYFSSLGIKKAPKVTAVSVDGGHNRPGDPNGADGEVMLDIEVVGAVATGASIAVYFAPNTDAGFLDAITTAVHDKKRTPSVISISWGGPESSWTPQALDAYNEAFQAAAAMGVTVCCASGDDGASDGVNDGQHHVDFPASSPYVLGCGGTKLTVQNNNPTDVVWNELTHNEGASGGGYSTHFGIPDYQTKLVTGSGRGVPDVAGDADPNSGYQVLVDGQSAVIGGTSAVAPLMAALLACINEKSGKPVGFINPTIYEHADAFRDITSGDNGGENAGPGWDACTGMGVPLGKKLEQVLTTANKSAAGKAA